MYEYQFRVYCGKGMNDLFGIFAPAWGEFPQDVPLENPHHARDLIRSRKGKVTLGKVDLPVLPCPRIDRTKPDPVNSADVVCRKSMVATIGIEQLIHRSQLFPQLDVIQFSLLLDTEEIPKNTTARSRKSTTQP